jgi:riboflavin kinase/FMN adenylyltransferase
LRITDPRKLIPAFGVYAVRVLIGEETHPGVVNLGVRPTFDHSLPTVEAHLLDYAGNLYGCELQIRFVKRLRDERRFGSVEELKEQIAMDCAEAVRALET